MNTSALRILRQCSAALAAATIFFCHQADAAVVALPGKVTFIEATYMPTFVVFKISIGDATCGPNKWLTFESSNADTMKAVYATLLANLLSGREAYVYYDNATWNTGVFLGDACRILHIGTN